MPFETLQPGFDRHRQQPIVGIEKDDFVASRLSQAGIARAGEAAVRLPQQSDARTAGDDVREVLVAAVVDDDDLVRRMALCHHALDRTGEELRLAEAGDHDGDGRLGSGTHSNLELARHSRLA